MSNGRAKHEFSEVAASVRTDQIKRTIPVGQLVAEHPLRACVLEQYGIDYCCGGKVTLEEACQKKGLEVNEVLDKLFAADQKQSKVNDLDWTKQSLKELIDHIVTTYHVPLRQELSRLAQLVEKVAQVHTARHPELTEVVNVFNHFREQLELHMQKEEIILFPAIAKMETTGEPSMFGCGGSIEHPIDVMIREHEDAGQALCSMRQLTHDYVPPDDACNTYKALLCSLAQLESEMHQHVHKENNILFPRVLTLRTAAQVRK